MIIFRVDANERVATGHLMRCIAIAKECIKLKNECIFVMAEDKETDRLDNIGIKYHILNTNYDNMNSEISKFKDIIYEVKPDWVVVDSYFADFSYLKALNDIVPVMYIDDFGKDVYEVSALIHYISWEGEKDFETAYRGKNTALLTGMKYAPLREEFYNNTRVFDTEKKIFITTGGTDTCNVSEKLLRELILNDIFKDYIFNVIIGSMNSNEDILRQLARTDKRIVLYKNINNMSELMRSCEYAVSAGGTTLLELCACKVPTVCFSFADNQLEFTKKAAERKVMIYAGDARENKNIGKTIVEGLIRFKNNKAVKNEYINNMEKLTDGRGAVRIADFLKK